MSSVEQAYQQFKDTLKLHPYNPDWELIRKAYKFAAHAHRDQMRQSGEPYIIHPIHVASNLAQLKVDSKAIAAGFLHDVLEDTEATPEIIEQEFGSDVLHLVEGVSKLRTIRFREETQYVENLRKMLVATAKDLRVIFIRLCDRLHNMQTLNYLPSSEQKRIAMETLEIYAPMAHRLQLGSIRGQLEDLAFKYLQPEDYRWLYNVTRKNFEKRQNKLAWASERIKDILKHEDVQVISVKTRIKFIYSLYQKLKRYDNDLSRIYDVVALRVIVPRISDCYAALGIIHREFKPIKGRIKDYIARPKTNGYTSLHTTVMLRDGDIIEVQIRTPEMHDKSEYGAAAHWHYKQGSASDQARMQVSWVKQLARIISEIENPNDFENVKLDLFRNRIFVVTPKGDVIDLPEESTAIDFAYHIHSDIGNKMIKAKINGEIQPVSTKLQNGDLVDILIDKHKKGPDLKWLDWVKTHLAKDKIRYYHRRQSSAWEKKLENEKPKKWRKK